MTDLLLVVDEWMHGCDALLNNVTLWIPRCPHCGKPAPTSAAPQAQAAIAWQEGYRAGVKDERISEANIGVAGFGAKVEPSRNNPYAAPQPQAEPVAWRWPGGEWHDGPLYQSDMDLLRKHGVTPELAYAAPPRPQASANGDSDER